MKIVEYNQVDPLQVLYLNMLALGFSLTPDHAVYIRHTDPRPFPCFAIYALEEDLVLGVEKIFEKVASDYLGFAWRYTPFMRLRDQVSLDHVWILWENEEPVGYGIAHADKAVLNISNLLLQHDIDATEAVAAIAKEINTSYIQVSISRPVDIASLRRNGYQVAHPNWAAFMVKPLVPEVTIEDARRLFGIGTDRFLISWLDVT